MKAAAILSSDLLDIIFENRNKSYGAYVLRKEYNNRLAKALLAVTGLIVIFSLYMLSPVKSSAIFSIEAPLIEISEAPHKPETKPKEPEPTAAGKEIATVKDNTPLIVPDKEADSTIRTNAQLINISRSDETNPGYTSVGLVFPGDGGEKPRIAEPVEIIIPVNKIDPIENPEVEPLYPGGLKEFVKFLERNLQSPEELEEGITVAVKVKFVVNYDGSLKSFSVIQTGGEPFDQEVLRVLKRMPKWIPGKSRGETVSVFYTVPVRFTSKL